jgi:hypothetical protein
LIEYPIIEFPVVEIQFVNLFPQLNPFILQFLNNIFPAGGFSMSKFEHFIGFIVFSCEFNDLFSLLLQTNALLLDFSLVKRLLVCKLKSRYILFSTLFLYFDFKEPVLILYVIHFPQQVFILFICVV